MRKRDGRGTDRESPSRRGQRKTVPVTHNDRDDGERRDQGCTEKPYHEPDRALDAERSEAAAWHNTRATPNAVALARSEEAETNGGFGDKPSRRNQ